jgi:hypothetical protein
MKTTRYAKRLARSRETLAPFRERTANARTIQEDQAIVEAHNQMDQRFHWDKGWHCECPSCRRILASILPGHLPSKK